MLTKLCWCNYSLPVFKKLNIEWKMMMNPNRKPYEHFIIWPVFPDSHALNKTIGKSHVIWTIRRDGISRSGKNCTKCISRLACSIEKRGSGGSYDKMVTIDWVRSGTTGKYKALGHSAWISPMTSSRIFSRPALSLLNKHIIFYNRKHKILILIMLSTVVFEFRIVTE